MGLLDQIGEPADLRDLSRAELKQLADVVREEIIRVVSENGGHLASNLGVIELTIALHATFNFFKDRLLFDVSHQCYTHKLLTGRARKFSTLRKKDGISGFQCRTESPADPMTVGHAGSVLSVAVGIVAADELAGRERRVVALVGDGALGAGNTFEALNHAGGMGKDILVVLNDNKMAIAETVGALSNYLGRVRLAPAYHDFKRELYGLLKRLPVFGSTMEKGLDHLRDLLRRSMVPGLMFEDLGFRYFGPVDGHDIDGLLRTLEEVRQLKGPLLLHVVTEKGRGYTPASSDPEHFHGAKGYLEDNGEVPAKGSTTGAPSYTSVFSKAILDLGHRREDFIAITAAMPEGTGLYRFMQEFPDRSFDVGICEQHALGFAAGSAISGTRAVVAVYSTFLQRAYDQAIEDLALQCAPVTIALDRGGVVGADGATHHGLFDIAFLRHLPGITLMAPKDASELTAMLDFGLNLDGPCVIRYPRAKCPPEETFKSQAPLEMGRAEVLREGEGIVIIAYGAMVAEADKAANMLADEKIDVGLVNARFAKPLDVDMLTKMVEKYDFLVTVEEGVLAGGFGSAVCETLSAAGSGVEKVRMLGIADGFVEHASRKELLDMLGLDAKGIAAFTRKLLAGSAVETKS